jgi:FkbM family methyltransferase
MGRDAGGGPGLGTPVGAETRVSGNAGTSPFLIEDIHGHLLYVHPDDQTITPTLRRSRIWEAFETELVKHEIQKGEVVVDLGANIGYYTVLFSRLVGSAGRVLAYEPDPTNFSILTANLALNRCDNVSAFNVAVSDVNGSVGLYRSDDNMGDHRIYDSGDGRAAIRVDSVRLDDHLQDHGGRIDFLKMDIQGAEGAALGGMPNVLARNPALRVISEFWPAGLRRAGTEPRAFLDLVCSLGFALYRVVDWESRLEATTQGRLLERYDVVGREPEPYTNLLCAREGQLRVDVRQWTRRSAWADRVYAVTQDILSLVPEDEPLVLLNEDQWWMSEVVPGRRAIPFPEHDGRYWGPPPDDSTAIRELERLRQAGARFVAVAWPAFWWLEYYADFRQYLRGRFGCVLENEDVVVFDLRPGRLVDRRRKHGPRSAECPGHPCHVRRSPGRGAPGDLV